ncbi:MAG: hypothetical protein ACXU86_07210, partial [Archangium sp.]
MWGDSTFGARGSGKPRVPGGRPLVGRAAEHGDLERGGGPRGREGRASGGATGMKRADIVTWDKRHV